MHVCSPSVARKGRPEKKQAGVLTTIQEEGMAKQRDKT
jgi:hypothetical protein